MNLPEGQLATSSNQLTNHEAILDSAHEMPGSPQRVSNALSTRGALRQQRASAAWQDPEAEAGSHHLCFTTSLW